MAGSSGRGPLGSAYNAPGIDAGTLARANHLPGGITGGRTYYSESSDPYFRARGEAAAERERLQFERRHEAARPRGASYLEADIADLLDRRKEVLYRWFALLKWLRAGLLKSGDPARRTLLVAIHIEDGGARLQTHRADAEDCQAAHLMPCNLRFVYRAKRCDARDLLAGNQPGVRDYQAFASNIFAATTNVLSIVNEMDSYLEMMGAKIRLVEVSTEALRFGLEPYQAFDKYLDAYRTVIQEAKTQDHYPEVIRRYEAGDDSIEGRIAKDQSLSAAMKKRRKLSLFDVYLKRLQQTTGFDEGMMNMVNAAYRSRHEEWGRAPNRLL